MTIREDVRKFKRQRILEAASRLFFDHGYSGTSVDAIASRLAVTKPFIYYQFTSKTDLLTAIYLQVVNLSLDVVTAAQTGTGSPSERLRTFARAMTRVCIEHREIIAIYFREEVYVPKASLSEIHARKRDYDDRLKKLLAEGVAAGEFEISDVSMTGLAISGTLNWTYTWYQPGGRLSPDEIAEEMADLVVRMVRGHALLRDDGV
jgi:AcrR family transcriptional regulator